jgi:pilus assembly protein CpaB
VNVIQMPKSEVPEGSFSTVAELKDRWVRITMLAGEPVVDAKLAPKGEPPGLVGRIPAGMRAFTVEVNEQTGVSGFILPEHRVDVIQNRMESTMGSGVRTRGETILQNVRVLAAGQVTTKPDDKSIQVHTVTLAVTPEQAEILVAAKVKGPLSLALRGTDDHSVVETAKPEPEPKPMPMPEPIRTVEVEKPQPARPVKKYRQTHVYRGFGPTGFYEAVVHRGRPVQAHVSEPSEPVAPRPLVHGFARNPGLTSAD